MLPRPAMNDDRALLLRYLTGECTDRERRQIQRRLEAEPELQAQWNRLQALQETLDAPASASFADGFSGRVMARLRSTSDVMQSTVDAARADAERTYQMLRGLFLRVAVAALLLVASLGTYNAAQYREAGLETSVVEAALGLPEPTMEAVFEPDVVGDPADPPR